MRGGTHLALEQALACHRSPGLLGAALSRPLPEDMLVLVRLAAGDDALARECAAASGESAETVVEAAIFFILHMQFAPGADSYRVLGVTPDTPDARVKDHYRWLVRWLHPDRNPDGWEASYADRVNRAWNDLRLPDRRQAYDAQRPAFEAVTLGEPGRARAPRPERMDLDDGSGPLVSTRTVQRLPLLVLGSFGTLAGALLMLMWYGQRLEAPVRKGATLVAPAPADAGMSLAPEDRASLPDSDAIEPVLSPLVGSDESAASAPQAMDAPETVPADVVAAPSPDRDLPEVVPPPPSARPSTDVAAVPRAAAPPQAAGPPPATPGPQASGIVAAPDPASSQAPAQTPAQAAYNEAEAHEVLHRFTQAYVAGDISALMRLFTRDASNNRGGRDAIAYDYQSLFSKSQQRQLQIEPTAWLQRDDGATVLARYSTAVQAAGQRRPTRSTGNIRFEFRRDAGTLRISQVRHDRD
ncbi:DnaJ domain-containing protein [Arenimonas daejeonensis]|uniref:DnaJ domain-containing protein n=1 Tax=Arenimonas daejeonensis TaxID=370777 RepID=UPI0013154EF8|nr:DnaJ domain-containing protein [Arenimonas daejeonensis]